MALKLVSVSLIVRDYDEAIAFFTQQLPFRLHEDTPLAGGKRWVVIAPAGGGASLLLAKATTAEAQTRIGDQTGGRVFLFLHTDDFWRDHRDFQSRGIRFIEQPREESYGTVAVFLDLYGNKWDLVQPKSRVVNTSI